MLAKIWKKLLLAICVIAILFNITIKLVNRISLEKAIKSTPEGVDVKAILNITDTEKTVESKKDKTTSEYKTVEEAQAEMKAKENEENQNTAEQNSEQIILNEERQEVDTENAEKTTGGKIIDGITDAITNMKEQTSAFY